MPDLQIQDYVDSIIARHGCLRCSVCHGKEKPWRKISVHHIMGRHGGKERYNDHRNLLCVCEDTCHDGIHRNAVGCSLDLGHVLMAKTEEDGSVDEQFLASLRGRVGLRDDPKSLPAWVMDARIDHHNER